MSRPRKRPVARTVVVNWSPACGEMFGRLANLLDLTPPAKVKVVIRGQRSTWTARYLDQRGQPVNAHVRLKHLPDGDAEVLSQSIALRFCATGAQLRGEA